MDTPAFIDSGAFAGFLIGTDPNHQRWARLFADPPTRLYTSVLVIAETYDWLRQSTTGGAEAFTRLLDALPDLEILSADFEHTRAVRAKLRAHTDGDLSYLGASTLVFLGQHRISEVWGSDRTLEVEGARVRPS